MGDLVVCMVKCRGKRGFLMEWRYVVLSVGVGGRGFAAPVRGWGSPGCCRFFPECVYGERWSGRQRCRFAEDVEYADGYGAAGSGASGSEGGGTDSRSGVWFGGLSEEMMKRGCEVVGVDNESPCRRGGEGARGGCAADQCRVAGFQCGVRCGVFQCVAALDASSGTGDRVCGACAEVRRAFRRGVRRAKQCEDGCRCGDCRAGKARYRGR